jgi:hypothetical protein
MRSLQYLPSICRVEVVPSHAIGWRLYRSHLPLDLFCTLLYTHVAYTSMALASLLVKALSLGAIVLVVQYVVAYLKSPLKTIPGPFLAKFSNIWRFYNHYGQTHIETQKELHKKYGDVVRLGPNTVSVADAGLLKTIYSTRGTFLKVRDLS